MTGHRPFWRRHIGPSEEEVAEMLETVGCESIGELIDETIPASIRHEGPVGLPERRGEHELLGELRQMADANDETRSYIGMGYHGTETPPVIQRNILENPLWYTHYTPYQSEVAQGRLEALLNFQTMMIDLTGMEIANASLLDEATAAAEAMSMFHSAARGRNGDTFLVAESCHPQTIAVVETRAEPMGLEVDVRPVEDFEFGEETFGALVQYPDTDGRVLDYSALCDRAEAADADVAVAADPLALCLLEAPGEFGADAVVGSTQRFGVPMGYGGPHAAYFACREDFKRKLPGRLIGVSKDENGEPALRMALQTREQHIREERATSNICTAQVLLAVMAGAYGVWHGPEGLESIAKAVHRKTKTLAEGLEELGHRVVHEDFFDTLRVEVDDEQRDAVERAASDYGINLRWNEDGTVGVALDETVTRGDLVDLLEVFAARPNIADVSAPEPERLWSSVSGEYQGAMPRQTAYLTHETFHKYQTETEMERYLNSLSDKDLSLADSMIPLGSCTMKLNAAAELMPISWDEFAGVHPFAPESQNEGYLELISQLEDDLSAMTGLPAVTMQPNSGAQGEYTGLLAIQAYHQDNGEPERDVCLIPESAHGTNAASASMAGMEIIKVDCDDDGDVDLEHLRAVAEENADRLAGAMFTYPSTHGVFEEGIQELCDVVHEFGGLVYMDGANMNAQVGLCRPADYGVDICHLNLHKTFAIPHGGGGPGVGPVCATEELGEMLPSHPLADVGGDKAPGPVSAAPYGSASILPISWMYIRLMGEEGLRRASETAVLNANYMADRLEGEYPVLYRGDEGRVAHEFIIDCREFRQEHEVTVGDMAKRLMDFGFHAPTMSWPVHETMMVEPTESESKAELDRFCDALVAIRDEIRSVEQGEIGVEDSPLRAAPHTAESLVGEWDRAYDREKAVYPAEWVKDDKFWPPVARVDDAFGDRNLMCSCPDIDALAD